MTSSKYEARMRALQQKNEIMLPNDRHIILQLDGVGFSKWTKTLAFPYDLVFVKTLDDIAAHLLQSFSGAIFAYVQSDEINIVLAPPPESGNYSYAGRVLKLSSIAAAQASALMTRAYPDKPIALFDGRAFSVENEQEALDWFAFRQMSAIKNSVRQVAHSHFTAKELHGKNTSDTKAMLSQLGDPWESYPEGVRFGRVVSQYVETKTTTFEHKRTKEIQTVEHPSKIWKATPAPLFSERSSDQSIVSLLSH